MKVGCRGYMNRRWSFIHLGNVLGIAVIKGVQEVPSELRNTST